MNDAETAERLYRDLPDSLAVHLHQIDVRQDRVLLVRLAPQDYSDASFLDQRLLTGKRDRAWCAWDHVQERMRESPPGAFPHYILHVGHCGSTLVSRVLGELGVTPLREPLPLRTLADMQVNLGAADCPWPVATFESRLALTLRLFARGAGAKAVKASSFCNDLAPSILASGPDVRATIVYAAPRAHVANLLAGPNSRLDLQALTPMRLHRLSARIGAPAVAPDELSPGVAAAMSWASEMAALAALMDTAGAPRIRAIDFDRFLADIPGSIAALAAHAAPAAAPERIATVAASPILVRYSKAPEFAYDATLRRRVLADAGQEWGAEIRAGLHWLERAAALHPAIGRAVELFGGR